ASNRDRRDEVCQRGNHVTTGVSQSKRNNLAIPGRQPKRARGIARGVQHEKSGQGTEREEVPWKQIGGLSNAAGLSVPGSQTAKQGDQPAYGSPIEPRWGLQ